MAVRKARKQEDKYFREDEVTKTGNKLVKKDGQNQDWNRLKIMIFRGNFWKSQNMQTKMYAET